ncbi:MAG: glutathione transferase GstA [Steroidobacteraceae bacterium]
MKLYYLKGACSLATYISLNETGRQFEAFEVDRATRKASDGKELASLNAKGYVPVLVLDDGQTISENVAVLTYVAGLDPSKKLAPAGALGQIRLIEALAFVNTELHKTVSALFNPKTPDAYKAIVHENVPKRLALIEKTLEKTPFLLGDDFSAADAYLWVVLSWSPRIGIDLTGFPKIQDFQKRVGARPSVKAALKGEGLE